MAIAAKTVNPKAKFPESIQAIPPPIRDTIIIIDLVGAFWEDFEDFFELLDLFDMSSTLKI